MTGQPVVMTEPAYADRVKVRFRLERDDGSWPPAESEGLWAEHVGGDEYRIDNSPWFVRNLSNGDVVGARAGVDGVLWATDHRQRSGRLTVRVIPRKGGPMDGDLQPLVDLFAPYRVDAEGFGQFRLVALDIPSDADLAAIKALLQRGEADGHWDYEEGCVNAEWTRL